MVEGTVFLSAPSIGTLVIPLNFFKLTSMSGPARLGSR